MNIQRLNLRLCLSLLLCAPFAAGCLQTDPGPQGQMPPCDFGAVCPAPADGFPTETQTPPILLADGTTTDDPCVKNEQDSMAIRSTYCGACHQEPAHLGTKEFGFILDDGMLTSNMATPASANTPPLLYINPGDPANSRVYQRIVNQEMPPIQRSVDQPDNPRPTFSDVSVLYQWIMCLKK